MKHFLQILTVFTLSGQSSLLVDSCDTPAEARIDIDNWVVSDDGLKIFFQKNPTLVVKQDDFQIYVNHKKLTDYLVSNQYNLIALKTPISQNDTATIQFKNNPLFELYTFEIDENIRLDNVILIRKAGTSFLKLTFNAWEDANVFSTNSVQIKDNSNYMYYEITKHYENTFWIKLYNNPKSKEIYVSYAAQSWIKLKIYLF